MKTPYTTEQHATYRGNKENGSECVAIHSGLVANAEVVGGENFFGVANFLEIFLPLQVPAQNKAFVHRTS